MLLSVLSLALAAGMPLLTDSAVVGVVAYRQTCYDRTNEAITTLPSTYASSVSVVSMVSFRGVYDTL